MREKFHIHAESTENYTRLCFNQVHNTTHRSKYIYAHAYHHLQVQASANILLLIPKSSYICSCPLSSKVVLTSKTLPICHRSRISQLHDHYHFVSQRGRPQSYDKFNLVLEDYNIVHLVGSCFPLLRVVDSQHKQQISGTM
jgi:hypothetical protein